MAFFARRKPAQSRAVASAIYTKLFIWLLKLERTLTGWSAFFANLLPIVPVSWVHRHGPSGAHQSDGDADARPAM
jgi:hypothetical protein